MRRRVLIGAASTITLVVYSTAAFALPPWHRQASPTPSGRTGALVAAACPSSSSCWAVGYSQPLGFNSYRRLVEQYAGGHWSIVVTPGPAGDTLLYGVSCASAAFCVAVGESPPAPLIERWNGTSWATQPAPAPHGSFLKAVTCLSPSNCFAVGGTGTATSAPHAALAEHWNGSTWSRQTTPGAAAGVADILDAISCVSSTDCTAVGLHERSPGASVLAEHWNGTAWSRRDPLPLSGRDTWLSGVTCLSSNSCFAVGGSSPTTSDTTRRLAEHWNGSTWSIVVTPAPGTETLFSAISCAQGQCVAVGSADQQPLADHWDGATWTTESVPMVAARGEFGGVSCVTVNTCVAVGGDLNEKTLIDRRG